MLEGSNRAKHNKDAVSVRRAGDGDTGCDKGVIARIERAAKREGVGETRIDSQKGKDAMGT